ncbi:hypothetical protein ZEAMMB73_Zm00001d040162 [Zea mays]|uniref:Peroxisomal membrane protein PEX14 n=3 Tax=Zea mays TaxID=4577 RepID=A0A1D6MNI3_MAIZE|nr:hypothetical protein ZEAMMB73_Zm00001d040162 [Zea mays]
MAEKSPSSAPQGGSGGNESFDNLVIQAPQLMREDYIQNAVKFLSHPKVKGSPVFHRRSFLEKKGLTSEEIDEAFCRVPDPKPNGTDAVAAGRQQANNPSQSVVLQPYTEVQPQAATASATAGPIVPHTKAQLSWVNTLLGAGLFLGLGASAAITLKKLVIPSLKSWTRRVVAEGDENAKSEHTSKLCEEIREAIKVSASAFSDIAKINQEVLASKDEDRKVLMKLTEAFESQENVFKSLSETLNRIRENQLSDCNFRNFGLLNSALITLLPKLEGAALVKDFRPISLIHSFAKLVTKMMANRLAGHLGAMVSPNQTAFIKKRFILDNFILVQRTARYLHQQRQARILFKLDISKAFDSVSWPFLIEVLRKMGFGQIWCDVVCGLLASSSTRILLNGVPGEIISHQRGLRQGDPLSPLLFILVMDVLNLLIQKASDEGLLQQLSSGTLHHRLSLYADDAVVFLRPVASDISLVLEILRLFGEASGLKTNVLKSSVFPIRCTEDDLMRVQASLPCPISDFPCQYLGLPLSLGKLSKAQLQALVDKAASVLPGWKADLMTKAGRAVYVQFVLTAKMIYAAMALDLPIWTIKAIDKIRRGFLWKGRKQANGGHCLVAWGKVTRPKVLGGLGITDLWLLSVALRARWPWLQRTDHSKPWSVLPVQACGAVEALINVAVVSQLGDGQDILFWKDRWLNGRRISEVAPEVLEHVPKCVVSKRLVKDALTNLNWVADIRGALSVRALAQVLDLCDLLEGLVLQPGIPDKHSWKFSASGDYSSSSAYQVLLLGAVEFRPAERIWKTWAPRKCKFFMWLVVHDRCWTADRLAKRGMDHPVCCPLCDQADETINHLLVECSFAKQFWFLFLRSGDFQVLCPSTGDGCFDSWWEKSAEVVGKPLSGGFNSLVILGAWSIWKHRNRCVFDGCSPNVEVALSAAREELMCWRLAGAKTLSFFHLEELS